MFWFYWVSTYTTTHEAVVCNQNKCVQYSSQTKNKLSPKNYSILHMQEI